MVQRSLILWLCTLLATSLVGQNNKTDSLLQNRDTTFVTVLGSAELLQSTLNSGNLLKGTEPDLINALDHLPGVFKIHEAGFPLVYRGMSANRLRIERNGALRTGFVAQGYLLDDVNPDNVAQLQVVKGAESVLYGSGGAGGIIRIEEASAGEFKGSNAYLSYGSNAPTKTIGLKTGSGKKGGIGWLLSGRWTDSDDFQYGTGETANNSARAQQSLKLSLSTGNSSNTHWVWNHDLSGGMTERPQGFQNNPFELRRYKNHYGYQSNLKTVTALNGASRLEQNTWVLFTESDQELRKFNGTFEQINVFEVRNYTKQAFGYRVDWKGQQQGAWQLRFGGDFISSRVDQQDTRDDFLIQRFDEVVFTQSRRENLGGIYGLAQYQAGRMVLDFSLRSDLASIGNATDKSQHTVLSGGITAKWQQHEKLRQTLSVTRQFRYPTQDESVGLILGGRGIFRGNPDIQPEYSNQVEWSISGKHGDRWEFALSSWLALFEGRISEFFLGGNDYTYRNLDRSRTMGIEGRVDYQLPTANPADLAFVSISGSIIQGDNLGSEGWLGTGEPLAGINPGRLRVSGRWQRQVSAAFSIHGSIDAEHVLAYDRLPEGVIRQTFGVQETAAYWLTGLEVSAKRKIKRHTWELGIRVSNLMNHDFYPFGARIMGMGRNINTFLRLVL